MKSSDFITESKHSNAVKTEAVNKEHALYKEYMNLKKMPISDLRSIIQRQQKIVDVTEYTTKDHAASAILRHRHGDKRVDAVFGGHVDERGVAEGRPSQQHPLEDHEYHKKSDAELIYIAKDARAAAEAAKSMNNTTAENKYLDQANDSATVRHFRKTSGMPDWYKKKYGHMNEKVDQIDELKMGTLARYATKAGKSGLSADIEAARKRDMGDSEGAAASQQKSEKRYAGHYQAINKINNRMKSGVNVAEEVKVPTADGITMQDIRLVAGEGKLTKKTVLQAITVIRKQRKDKGVAEGSGETKVGIEAHGVRGVNSNKWKKTFKSREAFEKWLDQNEGDVEVSGTREVNLNDMFKESIKEANLDEVLAADYSGNVVSTKHKPKKVKPSMGGESPHPYQGSLVGEQQHDPKHIKMAIGIASDPRHKGGDYTGAHNKIEKIAKGLTSHPRVAAVLKKQNEAVKEGLGEGEDRGEYDYERKLDRDKDYEDDYKFIPLNKRKKPAAKDDGLAEQQNSRAYQAGFSDGQMGREDPRSSSKYGPGVDDYRQGYTDGVKRERQAKQDRSAKYQSDIAPYLKMSDQELAAADKQARDRHEEIFMAFKKKQGSAEMKKEYAALNTVIQTIHQAKYQRGLGEGKLGKAAGAAAVVAAMMAGEKLTSAENSELGQTLKAAAEAGDTRAAEHLKNLDMYFDTEQTALITKLSNKYLHGVSESSKKKDACYNKVKSRYKVWPSAYASGALVKCRKVGAANWGKKSK